MPVQRIPRYVLLLEDLMKHTPADHSDMHHLQIALKTVQEIAITVNEAVR